CVAPSVDGIRRCLEALPHSVFVFHRYRTDVLELVVKFIQLADRVFHDRYFRKSLRTNTKFKLGLKILLAVEFLEFEVNALIVVEPVDERVIVRPDRLCMRTGNRTNSLPLLLQFFKSLELVVHVLRVNQLAQLLEEFLFYSKVLCLLVFFFANLFFSPVAYQANVRIKGDVQFVVFVFEVFFSAAGLDEAVFFGGAFLFADIVKQRLDFPENPVGTRNVIAARESLDKVYELFFRERTVVLLLVVFVMGPRILI